MKDISSMFASKVFSLSVMKQRLPKDTYKEMLRCINEGKRLDINVANIVANAMKDWAIEQGATHFTHWFQPMTGITAEKHDSFISPSGEGAIIMEFSGKELVRGESDASSFPNGGLRTTFEARGYTAWDPTSYAFIKDNVLCIPTAFCSFGGEALDMKTPLLRSMEAINRQAMRVLRLFGNEDVASVNTTVGPEQEYFLIDESVMAQREDLLMTGRTLFGAKPPKGQELGDHYSGVIKPRVQAFMAELNEELWKLGILAKTEHNEGAPAQHELAPIFTTTNISVDHNQLTMELMQKVARRHGMFCLLHEKPFQGVSGSGKHNNWSISTNTGVNLLDPGTTPYENAQFLLFLCAVIKAVDEYQDLLRISVATAGNDHRLGAHEAPPAVISMFLGDELSDILDAIENGTSYDAKDQVQMKVGVHVLPRFPKDSTDRNRTSPFAFTGNKFEFRMPGSSLAISNPNIILNTAVAESLRQFADILEGRTDFTTALHDLIRDTIKKHRRILFNGNGYEDAWIAEAERRGLSNLKTTPDALAHLLDEKNLYLFESHKVYSAAEMHSRYEILLENYTKVIHIEAETMIDMVNKDILPAVSAFSAKLSKNAWQKAQITGSACRYENDRARELTRLTDEIYDGVAGLAEALRTSDALSGSLEQAMSYKDIVIPAMAALRAACDAAETITDKAAWPYPSYTDILFSVR
ncbi:MAG: glutamine synthetase type III [Clostridiales bacterium]|nr:glutamine synthetase type III [Clostridiales bacterium]